MAAIENNLKETLKHILIAFLLVFLKFTAPFLGTIASFLWFVPLIILTVKTDFKKALAGIIFLILVIALSFSPVMALFFLVQYALVAVVYCYLIEKRHNFKNLVIGGVIAAILGAFLRMLFTMVSLRFDYSRLLGITKNIAEDTIKFYKDAGLWERITSGPMTAEEMTETLFKFSELIINYSPALLIISGVFTAFVGLLCSIYFLKREGLFSPEVPKFREWRVPWQLDWVLIFGLILLLYGDYTKNKILTIIGGNLVYILIPVFLLIGLAVTGFFFSKFKLPSFLRLLLILIIAFNLPIFLVIILILGLFDPLINLRKLKD